MKLQTKALYNLLRFNAREGASQKVDPWALENLRDAPADSLFQKLNRFGISLEKKTFCSFAEAANSPEELAEILLDETVDPKDFDQAYLILFELWRRNLPEKPSLSIFCDELDWTIFQYDAEKLESDESIQDLLANLEEILKENVDEGADPRETFAAISEYCAHEIETFLYDYISQLLDETNTSYASELIEDFSPFVSEPIWFDFLRARAISFTDPAKANAEIALILDAHPATDSDFLFEVLRFLSISGEHRLFIAVIQKILSQLQTEEQFQNLMEVTADYYRRLDQDEVEMAIEKIMQRRKSSSSSFHVKDPDLRAFAESLK